MKIPPITYQTLLDGEGNFVALGIKQGDQRIIVEFKDATFASSKPSHWWGNMKESIDKIQERVQKETQVELFDD